MKRTYEQFAMIARLLLVSLTVVSVSAVEQGTETGRLSVTLAFPLEVRGKIVGEMKLPPETPVVIMARERGRVFLQSQAGTTWAEESAVRVTGEKVEFAPVPEPGSGFTPIPRRGPPLLVPSQGIFRGLPSGRENVPSHNPEYEQDVLHLVNVERRKRKLHELQWDEDLARAARYHAADMARDGYVGHDTLDVVEVNRKMVHRRAGKTYQRLRAFHPGAGGENVGSGHQTPGDVVRSWMMSTGHRANILRADRTLLGVGYVEGNWVQVFGK